MHMLQFHEDVIPPPRSGKGGVWLTCGDAIEFATKALAADEQFGFRRCFDK